MLDKPPPDQPRGPTRGDAVFEHILGMIYEGQLPPGAVVNEQAIATQLGISRGPVREAVRRLQGIQIVTREAYLRARVVSLSPRAVLDLFQMREALEGFACRLAAHSMTTDEINALAHDLETARLAALAGAGPAEGEVFDFHVRIVQACGNQRIIDALCGDLYHLLRIYRRHSGAVPERKATAFQEHWQILRALRVRDGELAESLMRAHITRASEHITARMTDDSSSPPLAAQGR